MAERQPTRGRASTNPRYQNSLTGPPGPARPRQYASAYPTWLAALDNNRPAKLTAGFIARGVGRVQGLKMEAYDTVEDTLKAAVFAGRLLDPMDSLKHPRGQAAMDEVIGAAKSGVELGKRVAADLKKAIQNVGAAVNQLYRSTSPGATPVAPSLLGEIKRSHAIGVNQGRVEFEVATMVGPGLAARVVKAPRAVQMAREIALYQSRGFSEIREGFLYSGRCYQQQP